MKIIICGVGQVGWQIARHLAGEQNDVTVIDLGFNFEGRGTDALGRDVLSRLLGSAGVAAQARLIWSR